MSDQTVILAADEQRQLEHHERIIERGLMTFVEVGNALIAIRGGRLYRASHNTFEDYCQERWGIQRRRAYQLMDAAAVVANVKNFSHPPQIESQAAQLAGLDLDKQVEVWQRAVETAPNGRVTAAHVASVAETYREQATERQENVLHSSDSQEWYTPAEYIEAAKEVMGAIDLDPASCEFANRTIGAAAFYSVEDDGLSQEWHGRVFLNPPYGKTGGESNQGIWSDALIWAYECGKVDAAILLVNATPGNRWFAPLWDYPICFVDHRIQFYTADGKPDRATHSNCFVYLGPDPDRFARVFGRFGVVAVRYG